MGRLNTDQDEKSNNNFKKHGLQNIKQKGLCAFYSALFMEKEKLQDSYQWAESPALGARTNSWA